MSSEEGQPRGGSPTPVFVSNTLAIEYDAVESIIGGGADGLFVVAMKSGKEYKISDQFGVLYSRVRNEFVAYKTWKTQQ